MNIVYMKMDTRRKVLGKNNSGGDAEMEVEK